MKISNKLKEKISSVLIWGGILVIVLWALLKALGVIHSPEWIGMLPIFSGAAAFGGAAMQLKILVSDFKSFKQEVRSDFRDLTNKIAEIDKDVHMLKRSK